MANECPSALEQMVGVHCYVGKRKIKCYSRLHDTTSSIRLAVCAYFLPRPAVLERVAAHSTEHTHTHRHTHIHTSDIQTHTQMDTHTYIHTYTDAKDISTST